MQKLIFAASLAVVGLLGASAFASDLPVKAPVYKAPVDSNLGQKGAEKYVAAAPQIFDLLADPQERYDLFINNFTETTWTGPLWVKRS
jgi:hypothetical protein